jgi:flagellar motor switch protein FliN/FliY
MFRGMGTPNTLPTPSSQGQINGSSGDAQEQALIPSPQSLEPGALIAPNTVTARLPVEVEVGVPIAGFRVRNLLALKPGAVVESKWGNGEDMPVASGDVQLAWSEFEVVDMQLAVRLTRLV